MFLFFTFYFFIFVLYVRFHNKYKYKYKYIAHSYWHVENVCFGACDQESAVVDHVQCV